MATDLCALARHATWTGSGALLQTLQLIRNQQVRGSSPRAALLHESELAHTDPDPQFFHRPMRYDIGLPSPVI